jgi:hypothetical protein
VTAEFDRNARSQRVVGQARKCRGVSDTSVLEARMMNNPNNANEMILNVPLTSIAVDLAWNASSGAWKGDSVRG